MNRIFTAEMTRDEFKKMLTKDKVTIVKASADWCGPCERIADYVDELFALTSSNVQLVKLDVDESQEVASYLNIRKLPTFISFVGSDKMDVLEGAKKVEVKKFFVKVEIRAKLLIAQE